MMSRITGRAITPTDHLRQSVGDILATPIGTRVMRRDYGSQVPMLVDQPDNPITQLRLMSAAASALMRWEPRLGLRQLSISRDPKPPAKPKCLSRVTTSAPPLPRAKRCSWL